MTSFSKPTDQQVDAAVALLSSPNYREYFLERLNNPYWIIPLKEHGFFDDPQDKEQIEGGGVRHPHWPASQYLVRMADAAPNDVADILVGIKTENSSVLKDIVDAAIKMPSEIAVRLMPMVHKAIQADAFGLIFSKATDLCVQFGNNGQEDAAMELANALFGLGRKHDQGTRGDHDHYFYIEGMKKVVPLLTAKRPKQFIECLCRWLVAAIAHEKNYTGPNTREDCSWFWRPAIEEHEQNSDYDFPSEMVGFVRQAFEQAIGDGQMTLADALAIIKEQRPSVFGRLHIYLVNRFAEQAPKLARSIMIDPAMWDNAECKHEYAMLVGHRFSMLSKEEQEVWLGWVKAGPDMALYENYHKRAGRDQESFAADRDAYIRNWQLERLNWIQKHLSGKWHDFYQEQLGILGESFHADFHSYRGPVQRGWDSPLTVDELNAQSFAETVQKVDAWQPGQKKCFPQGPEKEGLASTFGQYVASNAKQFSAKAELLVDRQPIYVRTFIDKMTDAAKNEAIDIGAVLRLCMWVIEQPVGQESDDNQTPYGLVDQNWQWTRDTICRFLRTICDGAAKDDHESVLFEFRDTIVALLEQLTHAPIKSYVVDESNRKNPQVYDFLNAAINSPRGMAVDTLIAYARWAARHLQQEKDGRKVVPNGFGDMPEVRQMLERQIEAENACFESFSIIGTYLGLLHWIDHSWVETNVPKVFDLAVIEQDSAHAYGWAAWNGFLVWGQPSLVLYRLLRSQYIYAIAHLPNAVMPENAGRTPLHHLGQQLILLYGRGNLAERNDEALLYQFLETASNDVRAQTIAFVGRSVSDSDKLPADIPARFQRLWDWYWPKFGELDAEARPEGGLFGQWFTSKQFPDKWALERLQQFLQVVAIPDYSDQIAERLAELAETHLEATTRIIDQMIRADDEGWRAYAWREPAETILRLALQGNDAVQGIAVRLIDELGRRGHLEFGALLGQKNNL